FSGGMMRTLNVVLLMAAGVAAWSCSATDDEDRALTEDIGQIEQGIAKGNPGAVNGMGDYCDNPAALCAAGEGDCDASTQCAAPNICGRDNGPKFGFIVGSDVCIPSHCQNKIKDTALGETQIDCGGPCGSTCQAPS